eukprot:9744355-Alexandrium_andersonii.AAC.1
MALRLVPPRGTSPRTRLQSAAWRQRSRGRGSRPRRDARSALRQDPPAAQRQMHPRARFQPAARRQQHPWARAARGAAPDAPLGQ